MRRLFALVVVLVVAALALNPLPLVAQQPPSQPSNPNGPVQQALPCVGDCGGGGDTQAPTIELLAPGAQVTVEYPTITIQFCDNVALEGSTRQIKVNSVDRTALFNYATPGFSECAVGEERQSTTTQVALNVGSNTVWAFICDTGDRCTARTWYVTRTAPPPSGTPMAPVVSVADPAPGTFFDRSLCLAVSAGAGAASECGDLRLVHPLPTTRTLNTPRTPTLIYSSQHAHPFPLVAGNVTLPAGASVPTQVVATLRISGVQQAQRQWTGSEWSAGATRRIVIGFDGLTFATGVYPYTVEVTNQYSGSSLSNSFAGELVIVNRKDSPLGAGWWLAGLEELIALPDGRRLVVGGDGTARVYTLAATNLYLAANPNRTDTLDARGTDYVRRAGNGLEVHFSAGSVPPWGRHTWTRNRLGHQTTFYYDTCNRLTSVALPPAGSNRSYAFEYTSPSTCTAKLMRVTAPALGATARIVTIHGSSGRIDSIVDPNATKVRFGYALGSNRILSRTDRLGAVTSFTYDAGYRLSQVSLAMGAGLAPIVTGLRALESLGWSASVDTARASARIDGPRTDVVDTTVLWLNRFGQPRRIVDAAGRQTLIQRQNAQYPGLVTELVAPGNRISRASYDGRGNPLTTTTVNPLGDLRDAVTRFVWDPVWDFATRVVQPEGDSVVMAYDATNGNRLWQQDGRGTASRVTFGYTSTLKQLASVLSPLGSQSSIDYDVLGNIRRTITPMGFVTELFTDAVGRDTLVYAPTDSAQTPSRRQTTRTVYDIADRDTLTAQFGPALPYTMVDGSPVLTDPESLIVRRVFDAEGRPLSLTRRVSPNYTQVSQLTTQWRYDNAGRRLAEVAPDGYKDSTVYDPAGNVVAQISRRGHLLTMSYDVLNRLTQRSEQAVTAPGASDGTWRFPMYCPNASGALEIRNTTGQCGFALAAQVATFAYDAAGNMVRADNGDARVRRGYYPGGALKVDTLMIRDYGSTTFSHVYVNGVGYDLDGRRTWLRHPANLAPVIGGVRRDSVAYRYSSATGALQSIRDVAGVEYRYVFDLESRLDSLVSGIDALMAHRYDPDGRLVRRFAWGHSDTLRYDARGRVISARTSADTTALAYSGLGTLVWSHSHRYYSENPASDPEEHYIQDALGNARHVYRRIKNNQIAPTPSWRLQTYAAGSGRLTVAQDGDSAATYPTGTTTFSYDLSGNTVRLERDQTVWYNNIPYDQAERTYSYFGADQRPRIIDRRVMVGDSTWGLDFNDMQAFQEYRYDALGRRVLLRTRGIWGCTPGDYAGVSTCRNLLHRFIWDGDQLLYEVSAPAATGTAAAVMERDTGMTLREQGANQTLFLTGRVGYTHGLELDAPLNLYRMDYSDTFSAPVRLEPFTNWRGMYDIARGVPCIQAPRLDSTFTDTTWVEVCVNTQYPAPYQWQDRLARQRGFMGPNWLGSLVEGQRDLSGQFYHRNRYYDPQAGRFTQEDPIGLAGGLNVYGFAAGDPVNFSDPFGLCPQYLTGRPCQNPLSSLGVALALRPDGLGSFDAARRSGSGGRKDHGALDLSAPLGTAVGAADRGRIIAIDRDGLSGKAGKYVIIAHEDARGRTVSYTAYMHLSEIATDLVAGESVVAAGQFIGSTGDTGNARGTPDHLHFEIRTRRYGGTIDPAPHLGIR